MSEKQVKGNGMYLKNAHYNSLQLLTEVLRKE